MIFRRPRCHWSNHGTYGVIPTTTKHIKRESGVHYYTNPSHWAGTHFDTFFSTDIQIRWKFRFVLTSILSKFCRCRDSTAVLPCAKFFWNISRRIFHRIESHAKILWWNFPWRTTTKTEITHIALPLQRIHLTSGFATRREQGKCSDFTPPSCTTLSLTCLLSHLCATLDSMEGVKQGTVLCTTLLHNRMRPGFAIIP